MKIEGKEYRTIWFENNVVKIIDQTKLPHKFVVKDLKTVKEAINAINIAKLVNKPKQMLGIKFENTNIEKPTIIVKVV